MSASPAQTPGGEKHRRSKATPRNRASWPARARLVVLAVLITLFAVFNLKKVKVDWIFGSGHAPLIVVIVISLLVGHRAHVLRRTPRAQAALGGGREP